MAGVIEAKGENHAENTELGTSSSGSVWDGPTLKLNLSQYIIVQSTDGGSLGLSRIGLRQLRRVL